MTSCPTCGATYDGGAKICPKDGTVLEAAATATDPRVGQTLDGKYRLDSRLGQGGMGAIYRATHLMLGKQVAVKLIKPELVTSPDIVVRFQREARAASNLNHPNIAAAYDLGQTQDGTLYIAMELVNGPSLKDEIRATGPIAVDRIVRILRHVGSALALAHRHGIIHRDLKPHNIMLATDNGLEVAKLLDFGIAKTFDDASTQLTATGFLLGTPQYMSPEQAAGRTIDGRSDLYSLGIILYEMLVGEVPFTDPSTPAVLVKHLSELPKPPSIRRPDIGVSPELEGIALRLLAKDPDDRFQTADDFIAALPDKGTATMPMRQELESTMVLPGPGVPGAAAKLTPPAASDPTVLTPSTGATPAAGQTRSAATGPMTPAPIPVAPAAAPSPAPPAGASTQPGSTPTPAAAPVQAPQPPAAQVAASSSSSSRGARPLTDILLLAALLLLVVGGGAYAAMRLFAGGDATTVSEADASAESAADEASTGGIADDAALSGALPQQEAAGSAATLAMGTPADEDGALSADPSGPTSSSRTGSSSALSGAEPSERSTTRASVAPSTVAASQAGNTATGVAAASQPAPGQASSAPAPPAAAAPVPVNPAVFFSCNGEAPVCAALRSAMTDALQRQSMRPIGNQGSADVVLTAFASIVDERDEQLFGSSFRVRTYSIELEGEAGTGDLIAMPDPVSVSFDPTYGQQRLQEQSRTMALAAADRVRAFWRSRIGG